MSVKLPDPKTVAQQQAEQIRSAGHDVIERSVERVCMDAPWLERESLLQGLEAFHRERMAKIPSPTKYPESKVWVDQVLAVDRELQRLLTLSVRQMALLRSLGDFLTFRGYGAAGQHRHEKCRVVYCPETDHGQMHIKNVDDPAPPNWRADRTKPARLYCDDDLVWDGVGSGLHLDDEPEDIFPLPVPQMYRHYANDVPAAVEFLTRYSPFHGGGNFVLHDRQKRSVSIEKCSHNFIEVFPPDPVSGFTHVSGMVCRDPNSPQGKYQKARRDRYRKMFGLPDDGMDQTFWNACDRAERLLDDGIRAMGRVPKRDAIFQLYTTPWPRGLCKTGAKLHPQQSVGEYTLVTHAALLDERIYYRWMRDERLEYPATPEIYQY